MGNRLAMLLQRLDVQRDRFGDELLDLIAGAAMGADRLQRASLRLAELAGMPIPPESEQRIAETQAYRRRTAEEHLQRV